MKKTLCMLVLFFVGVAIAHPIKMSTAKLEIDKRTANLTLNLFWDDFSAHLIKTYRNQIKPDDTDKLSRKIISDYLHRNFKVSSNGREIPITIQSFQLLDENTFQVQFSSFSVQKLTELKFNYSVLMDIYDTQSNILHIMDSGERKSLQFTQNNSVQSYKM